MAEQENGSSPLAETLASRCLITGQLDWPFAADGYRSRCVVRPEPTASMAGLTGRSPLPLRHDDPSYRSIRFRSRVPSASDAQ
jgi:hypothetical protein